MKTERNAPCPCGSGKKYKKCCFLKEEEYIESEEKNEEADDYMLMHKMINNIHMFSLGKKSHIKEYKKIRMLHSEIVNNMLEYYYSGKFEWKNNYISENKKEQGEFILLDSEFDMETNEGLNAFIDIVTYKASPEMTCITEEYIRKNHYRNPEKIEFLHSMMKSELGLFEVTEVNMNEGYVYINEVFTGKEFKITDIGLSGNKGYKDIYIYTRIITYCGISFGTGLNFVFTKSDSFIECFIKQHKKEYKPEKEFIRFTELYNRFSKNPDKLKFITNTFNKYHFFEV